MLWSLTNRVVDLSDHALLMGVLNVTPDSFSDGGSWIRPSEAVAHALQMERAGADILDIGGESTRPGASPVSETEELSRVIPIIEELAASSSALISIDTRKEAVARRAIEAGASIINDVSGLQDPAMRALVRETRAGAIVMHMQGDPETMQKSPSYTDVVTEVRDFFEATLHRCESEGIRPEQLLWDPGIGFGKTPEHNLQLLHALPRLSVGKRPLAIGTSRKSFLGKVLESPRMDDRFWPTVALTSYSRSRGASLIRVHDVLANAHSLRMTEAILGGVA
ncbi:MAG: dihydropteroate synthase [Verrucomicrobiota bacterium]|jgi:dihydropteroate synthase